MICQDCRYADEYLCWWWYPHYQPTCLKGLAIYKERCACEMFEQIGRLSR
ncbi:MAG: hypothetical protein IJF83_10875 [Methanobrevibacter sp.]|nr:hypothetical protein [Methanobrevibacter sp.]